MKFFKNRIVLIIILLCFGSSLLAQGDASVDENIVKADSTYVLMSVNYISNAVYMGRKDSISTPYLYPTILYHHKSGLYTSGSLSYLTRSNESRIDLFLLTAGFDFSIKKFDGDISFTKYFFNEDSYNVISEVQADFTAILEYNFNIVNLQLSASTYFNNDSKSDVFLSSEISHDFITKNEKFQFSPTFGIYFGSQNFYEQYYINNRLGNGRGQGQGQGSTDESQPLVVSLSESEKFNLMAIEFGFPIWYEHKKFSIVIMPSYVIPQSKSTISIDNILVEEDLDNTFYFIAGIYYRL